MVQISKPSRVPFLIGSVVAASHSFSLLENFHPLFQEPELFLAIGLESVAVPDGARDELGHIRRRMETAM